jgi:hypothetical protein
MIDFMASTGTVDTIPKKKIRSEGTQKLNDGITDTTSIIRLAMRRSSQEAANVLDRKLGWGGIFDGG